MTTLHLHFSGKIMKAESRMAGDKPILDISLCKKNYAKQGEEPTFTWIRATIWSPPDWVASKAIKGAFISGHGEFTMRSYMKDGVKQQSAEVRCGTYDCEIAGDDREGSPAQAAAPTRTAPRVPVASPSADSDDLLPF